MKNVISFLAALLLASTAMAQQQVPAEFKRVIDTVDAAWNKRDLRTAMQFYAPDATMSIGSMHLRGVRDIQTYMQTTLDALPLNLQRRTVVRRIEKIDGLLLVDTEILLERPGADGKMELLRTLAGINVVRQEPKGLKILAVRLMPIHKE